MRGERECYDPHKTWDADTLTRIAEVVARYISKPPPVKPDAR